MLKAYDAHFARIALDINLVEQMECRPFSGTEAVQTVFGGQRIRAEFRGLEQYAEQDLLIAVASSTLY